LLQSLDLQHFSLRHPSDCCARACRTKTVAALATVLAHFPVLGLVILDRLPDAHPWVDALWSVSPYGTEASFREELAWLKVELV